MKKIYKGITGNAYENKVHRCRVGNQIPGDTSLRRILPVAIGNPINYQKRVVSRIRGSKNLITVGVLQ